MGDVNTEAQLRYEHQAQLRMKARREGLSNKDHAVPQEEDLTTASPEYHAWRNAHITDWLKECVDQNATDHSTIMSNPVHAEKALAYDVAMGVCMLNPEVIHELRVEADWRYSKSLGKTHPHMYFSEYFETGRMNGTVNAQGDIEGGQFLHDWIKDPANGATMPSTIQDERAHAPAHPNTRNES
jgi:hypothetical protein